MKKATAVLMFILILATFALTPSLAAGNIVITRQPQNGTFPENSAASWSVEAAGDNLSYHWFIVYKGVTYDTNKSFAEGHPWQDGVLGSGYGSNDKGNTFFINGIGSALDGAEIYCIVSNKTGSVTSARAYISVGGSKSPPELKVSASVRVEKGKVLKLYCDAKASDGDEVKSYLWYETTTGKLKDIVAIGANEGYSEEDPILVCDTGKAGTRYYVCYVETKLGGKAYSSVIPVTVVEKAAPTQKPAPVTPGADKTSGVQKTSEPDSVKAPDESAVGMETDIGEPGSVESTTAAKQNSTGKTLSVKAVVLIAIACLAIGGIIAGVAVAIRKKKQ